MEPLIEFSDEIRVLHVDDDESLGALAATWLEREDDDMSVETLTDPRAVLDRLDTTRVDCLISDYEMPRIDGLELLDSVRESHPNLPFVLYTGRGSEEIAAEAIASGVDAYLRKSGGTSQYAVLAQRVRSLVEAARSHERARKTNEVYELLARVSTDAFWIRDISTGRTRYSDGITQFGYEPGIREDGFEWWADRVHPEDKRESRELNAVQEAGESAGFDSMDGQYADFTHRYRWQCADDSYTQCLSRGVVRIEDGDAVEMVGAMTDVSDWDEVA